MIANEIEFKNYLTEIGINKGSNSSYRSRLNFLLTNEIDITANNVNPDNILSLIERKKLDYKDKSSLKTALLTYKRFLSSDFNLLVDLKEISSKEIPTTQKELLMNARIGQGVFRKGLIELWQKCSLSQFTKVELLIASHILPWRNANDKERLSKFNGLLLQPNFDKMFDKGFISFNDDGSIILSNKMEELEFAQMGITKNARLYKIHNENIPFLNRHREIFKEILFE